MNRSFWLAGGLSLLSFVSGMLGMGVGFVALPFLGLFLSDLVNQIQPLSLLLNGVTAASSLIGFAQSGLVPWRPAILLATATALVSPIGALLARRVNPLVLWGLFFVAALYLAYRLLLPGKSQESCRNSPPKRELAAPGNLMLLLMLGIPSALVGGLLGVGPGALLMPLLILIGFPARSVAAMNSLVVVPSSFSAFLPHVAAARIDPGSAASLSLLGAISALVGARIAARHISGVRLQQLLGLLILLLAMAKLSAILAR